MFQFIGIENPKACGETVIIYLWNWINFLKNKYSVCVIQGSFLGIYEELLFLNDGKNIVNAQKKTSDNISQGKVRENFSLQMLSQKCLVLNLKGTYWNSKIFRCNASRAAGALEFFDDVINSCTLDSYN